MRKKERRKTKEKIATAQVGSQESAVAPLQAIVLPQLPHELFGLPPVLATQPSEASTDGGAGVSAGADAAGCAPLQSPLSWPQVLGHAQILLRAQPPAAVATLIDAALPGLPVAVGFPLGQRDDDEMPIVLAPAPARGSKVSRPRGCCACVFCEHLATQAL